MDIQDFYDLGLMVEGGGNMQAPSLRKSDFEWVDYTPGSVTQGMGDYDQPIIQNGRTGGWRLKDDARARIGQWSKNNSTSISWGGDKGSGLDFDSFFGGGGKSFSPQDNPYAFWGDQSGPAPTFDPASAYAGDRNWLDQFFSQDGINAAVKTGDKVGTGVEWVRQGDAFVPVRKSGNFEWDTNGGDMNRKALMAFAALGGVGMLGNSLLAGNALAGAGGAAGGAATGGTLSAAEFAAYDAAQLAAQGLSQSAIEQVLAATGLDAFAAADIAQLALQGLDPAAITQNVTAAYGADFGGLPAAGAGTGFDPNAPLQEPPGTPPDVPPSYEPTLPEPPPGAPPGTPGTPPGGAPPGGSGLPSIPGLDSLPDWLKSAVSAFGPEFLKNILPGIIQGDGADDARNRMLNDWTQYGQDYRKAHSDYAAGLRGMLPELEQAYKYNPATVNNGFGTSYVDPATGKVGYNLNPEYQGFKDSYMGAARDVMGQAKDFDPRTFAAQRYQEQQDLLAPTRSLQQQSLMQDLFSKGGFGLTTNGQAADGASAGVNPYVQSLASAWGQQDKQMAYDSLGQGESYLDNLLRRQGGLFNSGAGIDREAYGSVTGANQWGNTFNQNNRDAFTAKYNLNNAALTSDREGTTRYLDNLLAARNWNNGLNAATTTSRNEGYTSALQNVNWGDIWSKLSGLFGQGGK
jgi:hypothetical protein